MDYNIPALQPIEFESSILIQKSVEPKPTQPVLYKIIYGDTLTGIADAHSVDLKRLWAANPELTDPNLITPDVSLKIPNSEDVLPGRPLPSTIESPKSWTTPQNSRAVGFSSPGNTYTPGQCTWGVKNWRPTIPNGWGNASQWLSRARAQGWSTGSTPRVGAIGWTSGHVVLILAVKGDVVTIKEMNYNWTAYATRTIDRPANKYLYIY